MHNLINLIESTRRARLQEPPRPHLGCSEVGHYCDRAVWLKFRHALPDQFTGRHYAMFRRGHQAEEWACEDLEAADMPVVNRQANVEFSHHFGGSIDGELILQGAPTLLEAKDLDPARIRALRKKGVYEEEYRHYVQVQLYMLGRDLEQCLYYASSKSKDTKDVKADDLYLELIELDRPFAERQMARGLKIIDEPDIPPPLARGSVDHWRCKICDYHGLCWKHSVKPEVNCRTCMHSTPECDGWECELYHESIEPDKCGPHCHQIHPGLVPWTVLEYRDGDMYYEYMGEEFINGPNGFSSVELLGVY